MRYHFLRAAAGNTGGGGGGITPWGWYGSSIVTNPSVTLDPSTGDLHLHGGYRQSALIQGDGSNYTWKRGWTGGNLTSTVNGTMTSSGQGLGAFVDSRALIIGSTVVTLETNYWTGNGVTLRTWRHLIRNLSNGSISANYIKPYYNIDWEDATADTYYSQYGLLAKDSSDNYIVPFYHGQNTVEGYDSSHTKQWTKQYNVLPLPIARTTISGNLIPCVSYTYMSPFFLNTTTGAITGQQNTITIDGNTSLSQSKSLAGYDSNGHPAWCYGARNYNSEWRNILLKYNMSTGALLQKTSIKYLPVASTSTGLARIDSNDNFYFVMFYDNGESTQSTPEYGPKILKIDSSGSVVWERVITAGATTSHTSYVYGFELSDDESVFYITINGMRDSGNTSRNWVLAFPTDGTATQLTDGSVTVDFKALTDATSRFSVTASDSLVSTTGSFTAITSTGTTSYSPYTAGVASITDASQTLSRTVLS